MSRYPCIARSVDSFVHHVAASLLPRGYFFFVLAEIPRGKDPEQVDRKLALRYDTDISRWQRCRRKRSGFANIRYLRLGQTFLLISTKGKSSFFENERPKDARRSPIRIGGYAISAKQGRNKKGVMGWRGSVRIERETYKDIKAAFMEHGPKYSVKQLCREFERLPFMNYAHTRRQVLCILRWTNHRRLFAGKELLPTSCVRLKRWSGPVFID